MQYVVNINVDNAAFGEDKQERDTMVATILRDLAHTVEGNYFADGFYLTVHDINGNDIGRAGFKDAVEVRAQ